MKINSISKETERKWKELHAEAKRDIESFMRGEHVLVQKTESHTEKEIEAINQKLTYLTRSQKVLEAKLKDITPTPAWEDLKTDDERLEFLETEPAHTTPKMVSDMKRFVKLQRAIANLMP